MEEEPEKLTYKAQPKEVKKKPGKCGVKKKKEREKRREHFKKKTKLELNGATKSSKTLTRLTSLLCTWKKPDG